MQTGKRKILLACASLLISLLLSLAVLELGLRAKQRFSLWREWRALPPLAERALIPSQDPELIFEWNPGFNRDGFSVNSFGMADREVALAKPAGAFRIAVVGDSVTANFGIIPRPEIYLNVLANQLDRETSRGVRFEALNFGVNAFSLAQSVRMLESRVQRFAPDLVIAQLCLNDPYPSSNQYAQLVPAGASQLWNFLHLRLARDRFWGWAYVEANYDEAGIASVKRGIARLAELSRRGAPILAVLFPYLYPPAYDQWGFERFHEIFRREARNAGLPLLDLYQPFRRAGFISAPPVPADPIHPGPEAHAFAAREIAARLDELRLLPQANGRAGDPERLLEDGAQAVDGAAPGKLAHASAP
jgi:lysophospholipase L1-like esterase